MSISIVGISCSSHKPFLSSAVDATEWINRDQGHKLSNLSAGDKAVIEYRALGCFSDGHYRLEFLGGSPTRVAIYELDSHRRPRSEILLGALHVSSDELTQLDRWLSIYRADDACASSSHTELRVSWFRGRQRLVRETLDGPRCGPYDEIEFLDAWQLIARVLRHDT